MDAGERSERGERGERGEREAREAREAKVARAAREGSEGKHVVFYGAYRERPRRRVQGARASQQVVVLVTRTSELINRPTRLPSLSPSLSAPSLSAPSLSPTVPLSAFPLACVLPPLLAARCSLAPHAPGSLLASSCRFGIFRPVPIPTRAARTPDRGPPAASLSPAAATLLSRACPCPLRVPCSGRHHGGGQQAHAAGRGVCDGHRRRRGRLRHHRARAEEPAGAGGPPRHEPRCSLGRRVARSGRPDAGLRGLDLGTPDSGGALSAARVASRPASNPGQEGDIARGGARSKGHVGRVESFCNETSPCALACCGRNPDNPALGMRDGARPSFGLARTLRVCWRALFGAHPSYAVTRVRWRTSLPFRAIPAFRSWLLLESSESG